MSVKKYTTKNAFVKQYLHVHVCTYTCFIVSSSIVSPEQLAYSRTPPNGSITSVTQLGPRFSMSFVVRNAGPSTVGTIRLTIWWPLNGADTGNFYYLYPAQFSVSHPLVIRELLFDLNYIF